MDRGRRIGAALAAASLLLAADAGAQWVSVARKALGRVERMSQSATETAAGYDVATVVIEGKADKVYATALKTIESAPKFRITRKDPDQRTVDFSDGKHAAGLKVSQVDATLVHLFVVAGVPTAQDSTASLVVAAVLRVCEEMGANCTLAK
jgi:hypothetical protein